MPAPASPTTGDGMTTSLRLHAVALPVLLLGNLTFDLATLRTPAGPILWVLYPVLRTVLILWTGLFLARRAERIADHRLLRLAALACLPAFLASHPFSFGFFIVRQGLFTGTIDAFVLVMAFFAFGGLLLLGWGVRTYWRTRNPSGLRAFLFAWFWASPASILLVGGVLALSSLSPFGAIGDGNICRRHPVRCDALAWLFLAGLLTLFWCVWRLDRKARASRLSSRRP